MISFLPYTSHLVVSFCFPTPSSHNLEYYLATLSNMVEYTIHGLTSHYVKHHSVVNGFDITANQITSWVYKTP